MGYVLAPAGLSAGCTGGTPSGLTTCFGGSPGSLTTPQQQTKPSPDTSDLDTRLARWGRAGGVSVRVDVKVWVNGALVEGGGGTPDGGKSSDGPEVDTTLRERLRAAFKEDQNTRGADQDALRDNLIPTIRSLHDRFQVPGGGLKTVAEVRTSLKKAQPRFRDFKRTMEEIDRQLETVDGDRLVSKLEAIVSTLRGLLKEP